MACVISLPSELVREIMSRLPGRSLARFRSVSKKFRPLLSDPYFLRLHHSRSRDSLFTLTARKQDMIIAPSQFFSYLNDPYSFHKRRYNFSVTNKANGLVHEFTSVFDGKRTRMLTSHHQLLCFASEFGIHLCDPVNKELKKLPDSLLTPWCLTGSYECLISFGFVDATMQYKVVKWPHDLDENRTRRLPSGLITTWKIVNELRFEVLNIDIVEDGRLKVSRWKQLRRPCPYLLQLASQVHVNGFIYWTTSDFQIVSFSLQDETFSALNPKPPCYRLDTQGSKKSSRFFTLSGSHGNLWMIDYDVPSQIMEIWKMEESGWAKIHKIDLGSTHPNKNDGKVEMLEIRPNQVLFRLSSTGLFMCYDAKTNTTENYERDSRDYQLCQSTDGLLSLHNIIFDSFPHSSRTISEAFLLTQP